MSGWRTGEHLLDEFVDHHVFLVMRERAALHSMPCWIRAGTDIAGDEIQVIETMPPGSTGIGVIIDPTEVVPATLWFVDPDDVEYVLHGDGPGVLDLYRALRAALAEPGVTAA